MARNLIHWNVTNGVSHIIYNRNMSRNVQYIRNDKPETEKKKTESLRQLFYSGSFTVLGNIIPKSIYQ